MSDALLMVMVVNLLAVLSVWIKAYFDFKSRKALALKNKKNRYSSNPGHPCDTHTEAIKNIKKELAEFKDNNRDDHKDMFDKIEDIWKSLR